MKKKYFQNIQPSTCVFLYITVAIATSLIGYAVGKGEISLLSQKLHPVTQNKVTFKEPYTIPSEEKEGWLTHVNEEFGYQISFPGDWEYGDTDISKMIGLNELIGDEKRQNIYPPLSNFSANGFRIERYHSNLAHLQVQILQKSEQTKQDILEKIEKRSYRSINNPNDHNKIATYDLFAKIRMPFAFSSAISSSTIRSLTTGKTLMKFIDRDNYIYVISLNVAYTTPLDEEGEPLKIADGAVESKEAFETILSQDIIDIAQSFILIK